MSYASWRTGTIYHIYPRSFQDTNGDGAGDFDGVCRRLDYLVWLGVDAIWFSPFYPSPMRDGGYDVEDYCAVDPLFGSLSSFDQLLAEAHARNLKIILDFVPNHTSDAHPISCSRAFSTSLSEIASTFSPRSSRNVSGKYPPAEPGASGCEPLKAAMGSLTRPRFFLAA